MLCKYNDLMTVNHWAYTLTSIHLLNRAQTFILLTSCNVCVCSAQSRYENGPRWNVDPCSFSTAWLVGWASSASPFGSSNQCISIIFPDVVFSVRVCICMHVWVSTSVPVSIFLYIHCSLSFCIRSAHKMSLILLLLYAYMVTHIVPNALRLLLPLLPPPQRWLLVVCQQ